MITVGLVNELAFLASTFKREVKVEITLGAESITTLTIDPKGLLNAHYKGYHIWQETVYGDASFFGVESCDSISRIMACIDNNDNTWREKYYYREDFK
jgi:hypothetical protein